MSGDCTSCWPARERCANDHCQRCDALVGLDGLHVVGVHRRNRELVVTVQTPDRLEGCRSCGAVAVGHGRRDRVLHDIPCFGVPVRLVWRKRTYRCRERACQVGVFSEELPADHLANPRGKLTDRAVWWAIRQLRAEHATVAGLARQLGVDWHTIWDPVAAILTDLAADESRFAGVTALGVDEHIWHHTPHKTRTKGPKEMTGMVDLGRGKDGCHRPRARLLDLVPGRSGPVYAAWLAARGKGFTSEVSVATLDPFRGYANAIDDQIADAVAVLDAFHVVKLIGTAMDEVRRRVQQEQLGHRGRKDDPLYRIRNLTHAGAERLTERQWERLEHNLAVGDPDDEVLVAWQCYQQLRAVYHQPDLTAARREATRIVEAFYRCPIPEIARFGKTLRRWRDQFLAYFTTNRANNGATEALNGIIELHRRLARGYRNPTNYRLRMILVGGGLNHPEIR